MKKKIYKTICNTILALAALWVLVIWGAMTVSLLFNRELGMAIAIVTFLGGLIPMIILQVIWGELDIKIRYM